MLQPLAKERVGMDKKRKHQITTWVINLLTVISVFVSFYYFKIVGLFAVLLISWTVSIFVDLLMGFTRLSLGLRGLWVGVWDISRQGNPKRYWAVMVFQMFALVAVAAIVFSINKLLKPFLQKCRFLINVQLNKG